MFLLDRFDSVFRSYAGFLPGLMVAAAATLLLRRPIARGLRIGGVLAAGLLLSLGLILAATLFPSPDAIQRLLGSASARLPAGTGTCNLASFGLIPLDELTELGERTANVLLFVPLGICIVLLPRRVRVPAALAGLALPVLIEAVQSMAPQLDRACEGRDVADNLTGLVAGYVVGIAIVIATRARAGRPR